MSEQLTISDEKWLNAQYLSELESEREAYDLDGWEDRPTRTFSSHNGAPWVEGEVEEADRLLARRIRERVRHNLGRS